MSLSAFKSFVREYLDPVVKTDRCAQLSMIYIGTAAHAADTLLQNIELLFRRMMFAGRKLSMSKSMFGKDRFNFRGKTISNQGIASCSKKIDRFLTNVKLSTSIKSVSRYMRFEKSQSLCISKFPKKLLPLYQMVPMDTNFQQN